MQNSIVLGIFVYPLDMKKIKKHIGTGISVFLLLCFSVTVLPMDFFHNHQEEKVVCKDSQTNKSCKHTAHLTSEKNPCWVCAIHFDNHFTSVSVLDRIGDLPAVSIFAENDVTAHFLDCLFSALRGPPQN